MRIQTSRYCSYFLDFFSLNIFTGPIDLEEGLSVRGEEPGGKKKIISSFFFVRVRVLFYAEADLVHDMRMMIVRTATLARMPLRLESQG